MRAAGAAADAAAERAARPQKKAGWAKAAPKFEHPKKNFTPRARPEGEASGSDRPKRAFKPREDQFIDKPRGERSFSKPAADGDRPKRPFKPREGGAARSEGPSAGFKRGGGTRSNPPGGSRPPRPGSGPAGGRGSPRGPRSRG